MLRTYTSFLRHVGSNVGDGMGQQEIRSDMETTPVFASKQTFTGYELLVTKVKLLIL
jgi:hypothetical protein